MERETKSDPPLYDGRCPNCRKDGWTPAPAAVVAGLTVLPFICDTCGFVALMHGQEDR